MSVAITLVSLLKIKEVITQEEADKLYEFMNQHPQPAGLEDSINTVTDLLKPEPVEEPEAADQTLGVPEVLATINPNAGDGTATDSEPETAQPTSTKKK